MLQESARENRMHPARLAAAGAVGAGLVVSALVVAALFGSALAGGRSPTSPNADEPEPGAVTPPGTPVRGVQLRAASPFDRIHQDQGNSIALPDGRRLWIFADTFQFAAGRPRFFHTSAVAVSDPGSWQLRYAMTDGVPTEFLPRTAAERADRRVHDHYQAVWPTGSTLLPDGRIVISYAKYRVLLKKKDYRLLGSGLFEFRYPGAPALVAGVQADRVAPDLWSGSEGEMRSPVYADGHVYFYQCRDLHCRAVRSPPDRLTDRASYRWWTGRGWSRDRARGRYVTVGSSHPGGNASVVKLPSGGYAMADTEVGSAAAEGRLWVAPKPWGPWSPAAKFDFPRCPRAGCYGLNLHPDQSTPDHLRVTYATNGVGPFVRVVDVPVWISADRSAILVR